MEGEEEKAMDTNTAVAYDIRASPNSLETHIVRTWGDFKTQRAVGQRIHNTIQHYCIVIAPKV